jgi:hypothetical protein
MIDSVSGYRRTAESPAIEHESLEIGFQSLAIKLESPALEVKSPEIGY